MPGIPVVQQLTVHILMLLCPLNIEIYQPEVQGHQWVQQVRQDQHLP